MTDPVQLARSTVGGDIGVSVHFYIDYRPHEPYSHLTHRNLNFPVRSELLAPQTAVLFDHPIKTHGPDQRGP
ncbi:hypothetical protein I6A60_05520 [Frankia sp. AgB1.9]|uniref:hypothetical protein n=1 Tax=unclassified Frankia TaxID=2632575 RepID=UPI001933861E|nr:MULTISPECIES: hypothetical protein [unclassified Frankia]MBL7489634.1 hypothetical protein [Frankia sp. AgW1.1]MBL7547341.1 hypothetical protein [Frankia sp. AgB1.9]MBL7618740.1 hypothetical protein [Frankia sp. AgB1.8]